MTIPAIAPEERVMGLLAGAEELLGLVAGVVVSEG